ncbi:MAG: helix-turn-helix domain-containing protein [Clostridiales Family XIII bacterium]|jgi:hypothetical protein|nr:helix-turn-helix domain-containing protein [Clostridiales Family XIII bacterium]
MVVTPEIMRDFLSAEQVDVLIEGNKELVFTDFRLTLADNVVNKSFIYYVPPDLTDMIVSENINAVITAGAKLPPLKEDAANCVIRVNCEEHRLFSIIQDCFLLYSSWVCSLYECIAADSDLEQLLILSYPVIKNPILLDDSSYQMLAKIESYKAGDFSDLEYAFIQKNGCHSPQYVSTMLASPLARRSDSVSPRPLVHIFDFLAHRTIYSTIKVDAEIVGFLSVIELDSPFTDGMIDLCERLTVILSVAMAKRRRAALSKQKRLNNDLFLGIFNRSITDRDLARAIFRQAGLSDRHSHFIAFLDIRDKISSDDFPLSRILDMFSFNAQECCPLLEDSNIILIVRDRSESFTKDDISRISSAFPQRYRLVIGFSLSFSNPDEMSLYYAQAKAAARLGPLEDPNAAAYDYDEIIGYDLLDRLGEQKERQAICHPAINILLKHDAEKGGNLIPTLHSLLKCAGNTALAAKMLFLHRNSLYYRIKQIVELTGVDLQNEKTREHLIFSLRAHYIDIANAEAAPER